jgi:hypothetical protein
VSPFLALCGHAAAVFRCPFLAQLRPAGMSAFLPLSGGKRTLHEQAKTDVIDPIRTLGHQFQLEPFAD